MCECQSSPYLSAAACRAASSTLSNSRRRSIAGISTSDTGVKSWICLPRIDSISSNTWDTSSDAWLKASTPRCWAATTITAFGLAATAPISAESVVVTLLTPDAPALIAFSTHWASSSTRISIGLSPMSWRNSSLPGDVSLSSYCRMRSKPSRPSRA